MPGLKSGWANKGSNGRYEQYSSEAYFLPAKKDTTTTQPLQEKSQNRAVVYPVEQSISVVNSAVNNIPRTSVYPEGTPNASAGQYSDADDTSQRRPVESVRKRVTSSPSQHLPVVSSGSGANAGAGQQRREQSTYQPNEQGSSCRPTNDNRDWRVGKPGVLMSTANANATGGAIECAPLSRIPELEISLDESSHGRSRSSDSSQSPAMRTGTGSPSPQGEATTSTPKKANSWSSPKRSLAENEETRVVSSAAYGRTTNASLSQEPEENSFELSRDLDYYRIQYNEVPSVDVMAENRVPQHRTMNNSGARETSDREASPERERPRESNLYNPLVITLSVAVVCLSLYIWLKLKN
ncbi:PREDICTED: mucin-1-like [Nanorana parkeri]|uniref:mucin-1-like n=1 Tax=Nanorana parkeri TaxID=125878 RepID=UPI0008547F62|nr:PREDICTED: mucin-1-like [Nanorana parkeri]